MAASKIKCSCCGKEKNATREFYLARSDWFEHSEGGRIPICKDCINDKYINLLSHYNGSQLLALRHVCYMLDIFYSEDMAKSTLAKLKKGSSYVQNYIKAIGMPTYKGLSSMDSLLPNNLEDYKGSIDEIEITNTIRRKWGRGFTDEEYADLETLHSEYLIHYDPADLSQQKILKELCILELEKNKARSIDINNFDKLSRLISMKMQDAQIKPSQKKITGNSDDEKIGTLIQIVEKDEPIIDKENKFEDVKGFAAYFKRTFIKPFAKAMGLAKGTYSVDDGDKNIELDSSLEVADDNDN